MSLVRTVRGRRQPRLLVAVTASALLLSGCGSRLSETEARDQLATVYSGSGTAGGLGQGAGDGNEAVGIGIGTSGSETPGSSTGGASATGTSGGGAGTSGGTQTGSGAAPAGAKAPIVLGIVGNFSGVVGTAFGTSRDSVAAWAKMINAKGGIDGHPIKLLVGDDGNNAANDLTIVRRFIEEEGAIAIIGFSAASGGTEPVAKYAQEKGIAVVGGVQLEDAWHAYPSMFPTDAMPALQPVFWAKAMKDAGKTKVAAIYCTEGAICTDQKNRWQAGAEKLGLEVVWTGSVSLAQPDFTAACSQARSNGAEAVVTIVDGESAKRYARDCSRQSFTHTIVVPQPASNPPATLEGAISPLSAFPWFLTSGSPALAEYGDAINKYVQRQNNYTATGWVAGKLMEKALTGNVSDKPTPQDVLTGLWKVKNETLGGLSQPLTFAQGANATPVTCAYETRMQGGEYASRTGMTAAYCQ